MGSKGSATQTMPGFKCGGISELSEYDEIMKIKALMETLDGVAGEGDEQKPATPEA